MKVLFNLLKPPAFAVILGKILNPKNIIIIPTTNPFIRIQFLFFYFAPVKTSYKLISFNFI